MAGVFVHPVPRRGRGFSLLEVVIVVVIIGVIAGIAIPRLSSAADRGRMAAFIANCRAMEAVAQRYAAEHEGRYPDDEQDAFSWVLAGELNRAGARAWPDPGDPELVVDWNGPGGAHTYIGFNFAMNSPRWSAGFPLQFDRAADDGNASTGRVRVIDGWIVWLVE